MKWLLRLFRRRRVDSEVAGELRAHIEERVEDLMDDGVEEGAARRQAARELGNATEIREAVFESGGLRFLDTFGQDMKVAIHNLARRPVFTMGTAVTLGLGIGATTCIYAVADGALWQKLPYQDSSRLVTIGSVSPLGSMVVPGVQMLGPTSILHYQQLRARAISSRPPKKEPRPQIPAPRRPFPNI